MRLAVKALEHPLGMARFGFAKPDVLHLQWLGAPELDRWLFRPRSPAVFTAHDIIPRRTLSKTAMWRTLFDRFERVVVHSERGRAQLVDFGLPAEKVRVIAHPVFRSEIARADDGRTALCLGLIRPYKGTEDAVEAVARRRRCAAPRRRRPARSARRAAARRRETVRSGGSATCRTRSCGVRCPRRPSRSFPIARRSTSSGALLQVLGAGVPAIVYDIGGLGEVVGRFGAGAVVPPGDVEAMSAALERLLGDSDALAAARRGAERAREELTWDASAAAHLELYRELV